MTQLLGTLVPGAEVDFSLDLAGMIPSGATLTAGAVNMRSGATVANVTFTAIDGTKVLFRVLASAPGTATFDVVGTFSNGRDDGEQCQIVVQ